PPRPPGHTRAAGPRPGAGRQTAACSRCRVRALCTSASQGVKSSPIISRKMQAENCTWVENSRKKFWRLFQVHIHVPVQGGQHRPILPPVGLDADVELEEELAAEVLLQVEAGGGADRLHHLALVADDDLLLAGTLDQDR